MARSCSPKKSPRGTWGRIKAFRFRTLFRKTGKKYTLDPPAPTSPDWNADELINESEARVLGNIMISILQTRIPQRY